MGSRTQVTLYDDVDGSTEDIRTVSLSLDGQSVELDLSQKNYEKLSKAVQPYLSAGRKTVATAGGPRRRRQTGSSPKTSETQAIRAWANEQGLEVSTRGRISSDIVSKYEAAQN